MVTPQWSSKQLASRELVNILVYEAEITCFVTELYGTLIGPFDIGVSADEQSRAL